MLLQMSRVWPWTVHFRHIWAQHNLRSFLLIINSTPCAQQNLRHDYIKTLVKWKVWHLLLDEVYDLMEEDKVMVRVLGRIRCSLSYTDIPNITRLLTRSTYSLLGGKQVIHLSLWRECPEDLTFLVPLVLVCEHKHLCAS